MLNLISRFTKVSSNVPYAVRIGLLATFSMCCLIANDAHGQCNPDLTAPVAQCAGPFTISLNSLGQAPINPNDIDNGSHDNCGAVNLGVSPNLVTCNDIGTVSVTLTVTDQAGNTNTCTTLVTVEDNLPPVIICPADVTVNCGDSTGPSATGYATATDNCYGILPLLSNTSVCTPPTDGLQFCDDPGGCTGEGITRTWNADYNGLSSSCTQHITVVDNTPPDIDWNGAGSGLGTPPSDITISCSDALPTPASFTSTDNCDSNPTNSVSDVSFQGNNPALCDYYSYTVTRTYKAEDDCGNETTYQQIITVVDDTPVLSAPATTNVIAGPNCDAMVNLSATVSDCSAMAHLVTGFVVVNNVNNQVVNSGSGLDASGTYPAGVYKVTFSAIDPCGNFDPLTVDLNVVDNVAPTASCISSAQQISVPPTGTAIINPSMIDNGSSDNCTPVEQLTFDVMPPSVSCDDVGSTVIVTLTVTDANDNSSTCTGMVTVVNNSPPAVFCQNITRQLSATPAFGGTVTVMASEFNAGSSDACDADGILDFEFVEVNGNPVTASTSQVFDCSQVGTNTVKIRVTEVDGSYTNYGFCTPMITIEDVTPPVPMCNNETIELGDDGMASVFDPAITLSPYSHSGPTIPIPDHDNDVPGVATSIINVPDVGTIADVNVTLNISHTRVGDLSATLTSPAGTVVTLFDRPGVPASIFGCEYDNLMVTFDDQASSTADDFENKCMTSGPSDPPGTYAISGTFRAIIPLTAFKGENFKGDWKLTVVDHAGDDEGDIDDWSLIFTNSIVDLLAAGSYDNCDVTWSVMPQMMDCSNIDNDPNTQGDQPLPYTLTVTDPGGLTASTSSCTVTIVDNLAPTVSCKDITVSTGANGNGEVTVNPTDFLTGGLYLSSGNDGSGNMGTTDFTIAVPNLMTLTFEWSYTSNDGSPAKDPFGYLIDGVFTQLTDDNGILNQSGSTTVTLTAGQTFGFRAKTMDNLDGNAEIWITDFSPGFTGTFASGNWTLTNSDSDGKQLFYDGCGIESWEISDDGGMNWFSSLEFDCSDIDTSPHSVEIRANDMHGNSSTTCAANLTIIDEQPPQAQCKPVVVALNGSGMASVPASDFDLNSTDACCTMLTFTASKDNGANFSDPITFDCNDIGSHAIILKVEDCATPANVAFCQTTITVNDFLPPAITCPLDITVNCLSNGDPADPNVTGLATATDNCSSNTVTIWYEDSENPANKPHCQTITRAWKATDGTPPNGSPPTNGNISVCFQTITVEDNINPDLDWNGATTGLGTPPANVTVDACNVPDPATPTGVDNCASPTPSFTETDSRFNMGVNQYTPNECGYYDYTLTRVWTVEDDCGNSSSYTQVVTVNDQNEPDYDFPSMFMFNNDPGLCAGTATINLLDYISDCAEDQYLTISYKIDGGTEQVGSMLNNLLTVGSHNVAVKAVDPCGNINNGAFTTTTFTIVIKDFESPVAKCKLGPLPITLNSQGEATITPADVNNNSSDNCAVASLNVDPAFFDCNTTPNPHTVTLTVTDGAGNTNICTTTVIISNASVPIILCPADITVECDVFDANDPNTSGGFADADNACGPVTPTYSDQTVSGINNCKIVHRTWTATSAGGSASCVQVITIDDSTLPTLVGVPSDLSVEACNVPDPPTVTATDNCSNPTLSFSQTSTQNPDPSVFGHYNYVITRTWSASDGCNSPTVATKNVVVSDNTAPVINVPDRLIVHTDANQCQATFSINLLDYISDCADDQYLTITNDAPQGNSQSIISGTYMTGDNQVTVTATDPCGNMSSKTFILQISDNQAPQAACLSGVTLILDSNGNGTLTPGDIDNGSTDNCGISSMSISPSTFNIANVGVVNVTLTVEDAEGNTSNCTTPVTVYERGTISAPVMDVGEGANVSIPVTVTGFDDICALSFSIHVDDPMVATVDGVSGFGLPGMSSIDFVINGNDVGVSWISGTPVTVPDGTAIFYVDLTIVGSAGSITNMTIDGTPVSIAMGRCDLSSVPVTTINGELTVVATPADVEIAGTITAPNSQPVPNVPIELVQMNLGGDVSGTQTTGAPGTYSFLVPVGSDVTVTPSKDIGDCNGISVIDVITLQQHILGSSPLATPYLRIAADVNNDGSINVLDRLELHLIVLAGTNPCLLGLSNNTSWRFVDATYTFPDPLDPFNPPFPEAVSYNNIMSPQTGDFYAVKIGDLNGDALPNQFNGHEPEDRSAGLFFAIDDGQVANGSEYRVEFRARDYHQMLAYQFTLGFDKDVLRYKGVEMGSLPNLTEQHFGTLDVEEGKLTAIWYNAEPVSVEDDDVLFTLIFDAIGDANALSDLLEIQMNPVESFGVKADMVKADVGLVFSQLTGTSVVHASRQQLLQNRPNPFSNETVIPFYLPKPMFARITVSDLSGKVVKVIEGEFFAGMNQVSIKRDDLPTSGVFTYRLETEAGMAVRKMILLGH